MIAEAIQAIQKGVTMRAKYVLICSDNFDYTYYPVLCMTDGEAMQRIAALPLHEHRTGCEDTLVEVYDLSIDIDSQLAENRPRHFPPPVTDEDVNPFDWL